MRRQTVTASTQTTMLVFDRSVVHLSAIGRLALVSKLAEGTGAGGKLMQEELAVDG